MQTFLFVCLSCCFYQYSYKISVVVVVVFPPQFSVLRGSAMLVHSLVKKSRKSLARDVFEALAATHSGVVYYVIDTDLVRRFEHPNCKKET